MIDEERTNIERIERERRKREAALLLLLLLLIDQARRLVGASIRMGLDPALPIRQVILGDPSLHLPGLTGPLANAMADSYLAGYRRAHLMADVPVEPLSAEATIAQYIPGARRIAEGVTDSLVNVIRQSLIDGATAKLRTGQMAREALRALTRFGWTRFDPKTVAPESTGSPGYAASTVSTNAVLTSWGAGYWNGMKTPAIQTKLAGFKHISVLDERTSDICIARGEPSVQYRKDDPYWIAGGVPPLHPRCRSILIPLFGQGHDWTEGYPNVPPAPGWGNAPAELFGYRFRPAA